MMGLFLDELHVNAAFELGNYQFTDENISRFAGKYAPVGFHMDDQEASQGLFGSRAAVGFHVCSSWMPCFVAANQRERKRLGTIGKPLPPVGAGFGLTEIRWRAPVFAGDSISWNTRITGARALQSKPEWGAVTVLNEGFRGAECVCSFKSSMLVAKRI